MRTIQMTLDDDLIKQVDKIAKQLQTTRSAFTRGALRAAIKKYQASRLELAHQKGYQVQPVDQAEFSVWEEEQKWGDK